MREVRRAARRLRVPLLRHDRVPDVHLGPPRRSGGEAATAPTAVRCRARSRVSSTTTDGPSRAGVEGEVRGVRPAALRRLPRRRPQRRLHARRLLPHGRPRRRRRRRLSPHHRPAQGHHHPQGREPVRQGHRGRAGGASEDRRRRRDRRARRGERRARLRLRRPATGRACLTLAEVRTFMEGRGVMRQKIPEQLESVASCRATRRARCARILLRQTFRG